MLSTRASLQEISGRSRFRNVPGVATATDRVERQFHRDHRDELLVTAITEHQSPGSSSSETAWSGSGGGISADEQIPGYQLSYTGPVFMANTISALTAGERGIPDVSFDANPSSGVSIYDSTRYQGQSGCFTVGGTSVGAPNWAGILAAGAAAGKTALQGDGAIYSSRYKTSLRDITSGTNGSCGTDCTAGGGYDLVTGLGSPVNYP